VGRELGSGQRRCVRPDEHEAEHDAGICRAEGTCCPVTNFFATPDVAQEWLSQRRLLEPTHALDGQVLDRRAAWERAHALFAGVLDRLTAEQSDAPATFLGGRSSGARLNAIETSATITCPHCGGREEVSMPTDACQIRYICPRCGALLRPLPGDCCVFCSYASHRCPPEQRAPGDLATGSLGSR
jgi:hypothetical protein